MTTDLGTRAYYTCILVQRANKIASRRAPQHLRDLSLRRNGDNRLLEASRIPDRDQILDVREKLIIIMGIYREIVYRLCGSNVHHFRRV